MSTKCVDAARVLGAAFSSFVTDLLSTTKLPINVNETLTTKVTHGDSLVSLEDDKILAPYSFSADDVTLTSASARVRAGTPAVFHMTPISSAPMQECVITGLESGIEIRATLRIASPLDEQVPVDINASVSQNCVLLTVVVPPGTPDGSLVIINNLWVAGRAVVLNERLSCVTIGFNHAPASEGAVYAAAAAGDVPGLMVAILNGDSTEQKDKVRTCGLTCHTLYVCCHSSFLCTVV
jgi:hypothetical protein